MAVNIAKIIKKELKRTGKKRLGKPPRMIAPKKLERQYETALVPILRRLHELVEKRLLTQLPRWQGVYNQFLPTDIRTDDFSDDILSVMNDIEIQLYRDYTPTEINRLAQKAGMSVADYNMYLMKNGFKRVLGFDIFLAEPYLRQELNTFVVLNSNLIKNMTDQALSKVQTDVMLGFSKGERWESIADRVQKYLNPEDGNVRNRAKLIARDQVNKLNGQLTELRQNELGIKRYIWRTSLDERVRPTHLTKEGKVFYWSDPPADTGHPGEDINCRCYAEPVVSDLLESVQESDVNLDE